MEEAWRRGRGFRPYLQQGDDADPISTATCNVVTCMVPIRLCATVLAQLNSSLPLSRYNLQHLKRSRTVAGNSAEKEVIVMPKQVWSSRSDIVATVRRLLAKALECDSALLCEPHSACGSSEPDQPKPGREQALVRIVTVPLVSASDLDAYARGTKMWPMRLSRSKMEAKCAPTLGTCVSHTVGTAASLPPPLPQSSFSATCGQTAGKYNGRPKARHDDSENPVFELVLLFYKYVALLPDEAKKLRAWHENACTKLGMSGRVLVATEGINGTLSGTPAAARRYMMAVKTISDPRCEGFDATCCTIGSDGSIAQGKVQVEVEGKSKREHEEDGDIRQLKDERECADERPASSLATSRNHRCRFADVDFKLSSHNMQAAVGTHHDDPLFEPRCPKESVKDTQKASSAQAHAFSGLCVRLVPELISTKWQWAQSNRDQKREHQDQQGYGQALGQQQGTGQEQYIDQDEAQYPDNGLAGRHLAPEEFHAMLAEAVNNDCNDAQNEPRHGGSSIDRPGKDTVILDVRNSKEFSIGHFKGAIDIGMRSFCEFDSICRDNLEALRGKRVMMYCTGGIRCEKASAWLRKQGPDFQDVYQLRGGIHRYLEWSVAQSKADNALEDGSGAAAPGGLFRGKNFVFDGRVALSAEEHDGGTLCEGISSKTCERSDTMHGVQHQSAHQSLAVTGTDEVVGRCAYCNTPWALLEGGVTCAVCRDPVLACDACRSALPVRNEYHCPSHFELRHCYFRSLEKWAVENGDSTTSSMQALRLQAIELDRFEQALRGDKLQRNRRRTLRRQRARVLEQLASFSS